MFFSRNSEVFPCCKNMGFVRTSEERLVFRLAWLFHIYIYLYLYLFTCSVLLQFASNKQETI